LVFEITVMDKLPDFSAENAPIFLTVIILGLVLIEWGILVLTKQSKKNLEGWINIASAALAFAPIFALQQLFFLALMFWLYNYRLLNLGTEWYVWVAAYVLYDFGFWFIHFISHRVRFFWCIHSIHHSAKEMKLSVAFRGSFFDFILIPHNIIWMPLLGFNPVMVILIDAIGKMYGVIEHINENWVPTKRWKWFEYLFVSPSLHRVHHSVNHLYLDRNYGETLSIWDRVFGTMQPLDEGEVPEYGIMKEIDTDNLVTVQTDEFHSLWNDMKSADRLTDKIKYALYPPGWNHVDGGILADELRKTASLKLLNSSDS
jgi:sterol desaturase/sphingolipid hydroxylase (fatty acid hydroxylase superfamily)